MDYIIDSWITKNWINSNLSQFIHIAWSKVDQICNDFCNIFIMVWWYWDASHPSGLHIHVIHLIYMYLYIFLKSLMIYTYMNSLILIYLKRPIWFSNLSFFQYTLIKEDFLFNHALIFKILIDMLTITWLCHLWFVVMNRTCVCWKCVLE